MVKSCCICKLEYGAVPDVSFHNIPKSEEIKLKWFAVMGREVNKHSAVCSQHFDEGDISYKVVGDIVKRFLSPNAVPTIHKHSNSKSHSQTIKPNNADSNNVSIPQVELSLISESNQNIDSHNNESMEHDESHKSQFIILSDKEMNEVKQQNVLDSKKSNQKSDNDIILNNQQDLTILKRSSLKRRSSNTQSLTLVKRKPRYVGDLTREDFTSDIAYAFINHYFNNCKRKQKVLNQKVRRLIKKVETLQSMLDHLKENGLITTEGSMALEGLETFCIAQVADSAEERDEERDAEQGDQERSAEEGDNERAAEEEDQVNRIKRHPKIRKDFQHIFKQFERLKKYLPPPARCHLEGLKLTILGYTTSKERKLP